MSFTNQKPFLATEENCPGLWGGYKDGRKFRCYLCGYQFKIGDTVRWSHNTVSNLEKKRWWGNFLVCEQCDGPDVNQRYHDLMDSMSWIFEIHFEI